MKGPPAAPRGVLAETGMLAERGMRAEGECLPASAKRVSPGFGTRATEDADRSAIRCARRSASKVPSAASQFWAPPKPFIASVIPEGVSMIRENRTTVTVSSTETSRP
jgi:hypothetical protein